MFRNYFKIAYRNLVNRKLTTAINIFGLSFGIACASLAFVFIQHEYSFDQFHDETENIHTFYVNIDNNFNVSGTPSGFVPELLNTFPEVTEAIRLEDKTIFVQSGNEVYKENILLADQNFFSFFNFSLLSGDKKSALNELNSVVLSETTAKKYFGRKDPIGEMLPIIFDQEEILVKVTGVAKNSPSNSSIHFDFVLPIQLAYQNDIAKLDGNWSLFGVGSLIRFRSKEDIPNFLAKLPKTVQAKFKDPEEGGSKYKFIMTALSDYHLKNSMRINGFANPGEPRYVKILAIIALLILLVACLNFMNLSNAQSSHRLKEVGVRQVLGARRKELMIQFLSEALFISLFSLVVGILLIHFFLPFTSSLFEYPLQIEWTRPSVFLSLLGISILTGLLAGSYPSFLLSKINAINSFKSNFKVGGNNWVTKTSLVFQFTLSIGLLACTGIMVQQQQYISHHDLGFEKEEVVVIPTQVDYKDKFDTHRFINQFRSELASYEGVKQIAGVSNSFNRGNRVQFINEEDGTRKYIFDYRIDTNYLELLQIELSEGRNFSAEIKQDLEHSIIVNEAFQKEYKIENLASFRFPSSFGEEYSDKRIIGIVKDYHYNNLKSSINPMMLNMNSKFEYQHILVKINPKNVSNTIAQLKNTWQTTRADKPFEFYFLDEDIQKQYVSETRWSKILIGASVLAILIAMFGLFGLLALVLTQRTKEIGIRKILGARMDNIMILLSKDFLKLIGIALILASPIAWYFMDQWLENFAYHIDIKWWVFALTGLAVFLIAFLTISFQSIKAALLNPVDTLKNE